MTETIRCIVVVRDFGPKWDKNGKDLPKEEVEWDEDF